MVAIGSAEKLILIDTGAWRPKAVLTGVEIGSLTDIAFSPDNSLVVGVSVANESGQGELLVWDAQTYRLLRRVFNVSHPYDGKVHGPISFLPSGRTLLCGAYLLNLRHPRSRLEPLLGLQDRHFLAISPRNTMIVTISPCIHGPTLELWNSKTRKLKRRWRIHTNRGANALFSPDGSLLAVTQREGKTVNLWIIDSV